jgi:hypothetical protein
MTSLPTSSKAATTGGPSAMGYTLESLTDPSPVPATDLSGRSRIRATCQVSAFLRDPRHADALTTSTARLTQDAQIHTPGPATSGPAPEPGRPQNEQAS